MKKHYKEIPSDRTAGYSYKVYREYEESDFGGVRATGTIKYVYPNCDGSSNGSISFVIDNTSCGDATCG